MSAAWLLLAGAPALGAVSVEVGPRARVRTLPRRRAELYEIIVNGTTGDVPKLASQRWAPLRKVSVMATGTETFLVRVYLRDADQELRATIDDGLLVLDVGPRGGPPVYIDAGGDLDAAIQGMLDVPDPDPRLPLEILQGPGLADALTPRTAADLVLPDVGTLDWAALDRSRAKYVTADAPALRAREARELGMLHLRAGQYREASHYLSQAPEFPAVMVERAWASLGAGRWAKAREQLRQAHARGGDPILVLEGLAVACLADASPDCAGVAMALGGATARWQALLVAAEVLQQGGRFSASLEPLDRLVQDEAGAAHPTVPLRLGDALVHLGHHNRAARAYAGAPEAAARDRAVWMELLEHTPRTWAEAIPRVRTDVLTDSRPESRYLLAQIHVASGDAPSAIEALAGILASGAPTDPEVPRVLWDQFDALARALAVRGRHGDLVRLYHDAWSPGLRPYILDPTPLVLARDAYVALGMPEQSLRPLRQAVGVLRVRGEEHPEHLYRLAARYREVGKAEECLKTLDYLVAQGHPPERGPDIALLRAVALEQLGRLEQADAVLATVTEPETAALEAGLIRAGLAARRADCPTAVASFGQLLGGVEGAVAAAGQHPPRALYWWARCLDQVGEHDDARRLAQAAATRLDDPELQGHALYLADAAGADVPGIWGELLVARSAVEATSATVDARRQR